MPKQDRALDLEKASDKSALIDRLLVEGELVDDGRGHRVRVYPMSQEIADRVGVTPSWISKFAKRNRCFQRRKEFQARVESKAQDERERQEAKRLAFDTDRALRLCDRILEKYEEAVENDGIGRITAADVNTVLRLRSYLQGGADSRQEIQGSLSLEAAQEAHRAMLSTLRNASAAESGMDEEQPDATH